MFFVEYQTPFIGKLVLVACDDGLTDCWFERDRFSASHSLGGYKRNGHSPVLEQAIEWLDRYFEGDRPSLWELPLVPKGTEFQLLVREAMLEIPYGETRTYGWIARRIEEKTGKPRSARAVGGAVGRNPLGLIVPCHRVMGAGGNLTGFGGGLSTKIRLLEHEGVDMSGFHMPKVIPNWNDQLDS